MSGQEPAIEAAVAALGPGPLEERALRRHVDRLFSRVLARPGHYFANHSLGRPLDRTAQDVADGLSLWYRDLGEAWSAWLAAQARFRRCTAQLIGAGRGDCVIPKTSAGQGLRTVLGLWDRKLQVLTTRGEFDSIDIILRHHRDRGRIELRFIEPDPRGWFATEDILHALDRPTDLLVISQVMFATGQLIGDLDAIIARAHAQGARVLVDAYHSYGVLPIDVEVLGADFMVAGSYKYLRGGPGACWLYVRPEIVDSGVVPLDTGWFAKERPFDYERPDPPRFARGGDGFLESTPPAILPYQAAAGLEFTARIGVARLREYGLAQSRALVEALGAQGVAAEGASANMGAFVVVRHPRAVELAKRLAATGVETDARGEFLRLTADVLTRPEEIAIAAKATAKAMQSLARG